MKKLENIQIGDSCGISAGASNMKTNQSVVGGLKNILFWSPLQKEFFENSEYSKVLFALHFGGGKSTLMKEKATQLAKQGKEVFFICMNGIDSNSNKSDALPCASSTEKKGLRYLSFFQRRSWESLEYWL